MSDLERFKELVDRHDLTFDYSDDGAVWRRGCAQLDEIRALAATLPLERVTEIWNAMVDRWLVPDARQPYYWKQPKAPTLVAESGERSPK
jgi:hypothetical protein